MLFQYVDSEWTEWRGSYIFSWARTPCWSRAPLAYAADYRWAEKEEQYERLVRSGGTLPYAIDGLEFA